MASKHSYTGSGGPPYIPLSRLASNPNYFPLAAPIHSQGHNQCVMAPNWGVHFAPPTLPMGKRNPWYIRQDGGIPSSFGGAAASAAAAVSAPDPNVVPKSGLTSMPVAGQPYPGAVDYPKYAGLALDLYLKRAHSLPNGGVQGKSRRGGRLDINFRDIDGVGSRLTNRVQKLAIQKIRETREANRAVGLGAVAPKAGKSGRKRNPWLEFVADYKIKHPEVKKLLVKDQAKIIAVAYRKR